MSAPGNRLGPAAAGAAGFTLLELMVVVAIIAIASAGVGFALRNVGQTQLEREGLRLVAMLEAARAHSRASGVQVTWRATPQGFVFAGLPQPAAADADRTFVLNSRDLASRMTWLGDGVAVQANAVVVLGPEPIISRQQIVLEQSGQILTIGTDGLRPFAIEPLDSAVGGSR